MWGPKVVALLTWTSFPHLQNLFPNSSARYSRSLILSLFSCKIHKDFQNLVSLYWSNIVSFSFCINSIITVHLTVYFKILLMNSVVIWLPYLLYESTNRWVPGQCTCCLFIYWHIRGEFCFMLDMVAYTHILICKHTV